MAIRFLITIEYRDDSAVEYNCYDYPTVANSWVTLRINPDDTRMIPDEAIKAIIIKQEWHA